MKSFFCLVIGIGFLLSGCDRPELNTTERAKLKKALITVNVTCQEYDFYRPWRKKNPYSVQGIGVVISEGRILLPAVFVRNATYVELEKIETGERMPADILHADYESNLCLIKPRNVEFLKNSEPLEIAEKAVEGDSIAALQIEKSGNLLVSQGRLTRVEVGPYPALNYSYSFILYRGSITLPQAESGKEVYSAPVVSKGKLCGMMMRFDSSTQEMDMVPAPMIHHFLKDAKDGKYDGFPDALFSITPLRDPVLKEHVGVSDGLGVYVSDVVKGGPAELAGMRVGDVLTKVLGHTVDNNGFYQDAVYGKLAATSLLDLSQCGDVVRLEIRRGSEVRTLEVNMSRRPPEEFPSDPYVVDRPPTYTFLGGLVFQELSRQYLREWGDKWATQAPPHLVTLDLFQSRFLKEGVRKIVILSQVLRGRPTIGYERLGNLVVSRMNKVQISDIRDLNRAIKTPVEGYHLIEFDGGPKFIVLDAAQVKAEDALLRKTYGLPAEDPGKGSWALK